jgi:hypothetical protein
MKKLPTDLEILDHIYKMYADDFCKYPIDDHDRSALIYVPIDVRRIAQSLKTNPQVLFGRLYYHLDQRYRYTQDDGAKVHLFAFKIGKDFHCINYPYLAAIVSEKRTEHKRNLLALSLSILSLIVAVGSLIANVISRLK